LHLPPSVLGNRDPARLGNAFDPRRDVDAITEDVFALDDNVADVNTDPELDRNRFGTARIVLPKLSLNFGSAVPTSWKWSTLQCHRLGGAR
jgi:hypothetical protein